jgi:hypothetical protein
VYQGVELDGYTRLGQWDLKASAMYLHARYARGVQNDGNRVAGAPALVLAGAVVAIPLILVFNILSYRSVFGKEKPPKLALPSLLAGSTTLKS